MEGPIDRTMLNKGPRHATEMRDNLLETAELLRIVQRIGRSFHNHFQYVLTSSSTYFAEAAASIARELHFRMPLRRQFELSRTSELFIALNSAAAL
jgi:hypothetical protein